MGRPSRKQRFGYRQQATPKPPNVAELYPLTLHLHMRDGVMQSRPYLNAVVVARDEWTGQILVTTEGRWEASAREDAIPADELLEVHVVMAPPKHAA